MCIFVLSEKESTMTEVFIRKQGIYDEDMTRERSLTIQVLSNNKWNEVDAFFVLQLHLYTFCIWNLHI